MGGGDDSAVTAFHFCHMVALGFLNVCFLLGHHTSDDFDGGIEGLIVRVHCHLGQYGAYWFVDASLNEFSPDSVLKIVSNITLAHGGADRHGSLAIAIMLSAEFIHGRVNHAYLGSVAVYNGYLPPLLDEISDDFGGSRHSCLLFRKIGSHIFVANGHYDAFFRHNPYLACLKIVI